MTQCCEERQRQRVEEESDEMVKRRCVERAMKGEKRGIIVTQSIVYPKEESELYNSTMETQWHPFYLSTLPSVVLAGPRLIPSPRTLSSHILPRPPVHLETLHKYTITIVSREPFVVACPVIYRCGLMNFLFRTRFIG